MERKSFEYISKKTGAAYKFAERNRADVSFSKIQNKLRGERIKFIQEHIPNEENQRVLLTMEMNKVYNFNELEQYAADNFDEAKQACYDSFKINNKETFEKFGELFDENEFYDLRNLIIELEYSAYYPDDDVQQALGLTKEKFKKFKEEQPAVYAYAKKHIKKK